MATRIRSLIFTKTIIALVVIAGVAWGGFQLMHRYAAGMFFSPGDTVSAEGDLSKARDLVAQGKGNEARDLLKPIVTHALRGAVAPEALLLLAQIEQQAGNAAEAESWLERGYRECVASPEHPRIAIAYARLLEDSGNTEDAARICQEVVAAAPRDVSAAAVTGLGRQAERANDSLKARELYQQAVANARWDTDAWNEALDALGRVNVALIFSPAATPESRRYTVQKGDSITSIGNALNTTQGLLIRANGLDETARLSLGQQMKYTPKDFRIVIERSRCRLFLIDKDGLFKRYPVGLGKPGHETTLGSYKIGNKEKNPVWHKLGVGPIPSGDPANELGTRWMPLVPDREGLPRDLGIHGTIRAETVGQYTSNGCARLYSQGVEELYDLVVRSTPVDIVETFSGDELAKINVPPVAAPPPGQP